MGAVAVKHSDGPRSANEAREGDHPPTGATLAMLIGEVAMLEHEIALLEHCAAQLFVEFADDDDEPRLLVKVGARPAMKADVDALVKVQAMLEAAAANSRGRLQQLLGRTIPGEAVHSEREEIESFVATVVPAATDHTARSSIR